MKTGTVLKAWRIPWLAPCSPILVARSKPLEGGAPEFQEGGVTYAPGAFLQANGTVNAALRAAVLGAVGAPTGAPVLDAFAGAGNFAWALAEAGHEVLAAEGDGRALQGLKQRAEAAALNLRAQPLDLFSELPLKLGQFETVVLDPPRAGADHLCKGLAALRKGRRPKRIVYVSLRAAHLGAGMRPRSRARAMPCAARRSLTCSRKRTTWSA